MKEKRKVQLAFDQDEFNKQSKKHEEKLKASNQQLQASEQQLRVDNQQLLASGQAIRESEEKFWLLFENIPVGIILIDKETRIIEEVNQNAVKTIGEKKEIIEGSICTEFFCPAEKGKCPVCDLNQEIDLSEKSIIRKNGIEIPILKSVVLVKIKGKIKLIESFIDITDRKQSEEKLKASNQQLLASEQQLRAANQQLMASEQAIRESEEKFKKLFERSTLPLCYVDKEGNITLRNDRFIETFGYTEEDVPSLKEWWINAYPDEEYRDWVVQNWGQAVSEAAKTGDDIKSDEYNVRCKDGSVRNIIISGTTIENNFMATFVDITERKQTEEKLKASNQQLQASEQQLKAANQQLMASEQVIRESEEKYRALAENSVDSIFMIDKKFRVVYVNEYGARQFRTSKQDIIGKKVAELFPKQNAEKQLASLKKVFTDKQILHSEEVTSFPGGIVWLETKLIPVFDEEKNVKFVYGISSDITDRKKAQDQVKESQEKYQNIFDHSPVSIWDEDWTEVIKSMDKLHKEGVKDFKEYFEKNPDYVSDILKKVKVINVNNETLRMFDAKTKEEMLGSLEAVFATPDTLPGFIGELIALRKGKELYKTEMSLRKVNKELINVLLTMTFPPKDSGSGRVLVSLMDITERKKAEEELKKKYEELEAFNSMAVGREKRMIELKKIINELNRELGKEDAFDLSFVETEKNRS